MNRDLLNIFKYGKFMGIFPFKIRFCMTEVQLNYSLPFSIYSLFIFVLLIITGICSPNDNMPQVIQISQQTTNVLAAGLHILMLIPKRKELECFINEVQKVDKLLIKPIEINKTKLTKIEFCVFSITCPLMLIDLILFHNKANIVQDLGSIMLNSTLFYLDAAVIMNYKSCVTLIRSKIIQFRLHLIELYSEEENSNHIVTISKETLQKDRKRILRSKKGTSEFLSMVKVYKHIFQASESLNNCFNIPILISSIVCMVNVIISSFILYCKIMASPTELSIYSALGWLIGHILKLLIIVEPCHSCQIQARYLARQLLRSSCNTSPTSANKLRKFYTVMQETPIEFHIGGVSKLTRSLIPGILSGFTTYLVILFQIKNEIF